MVVSTFLNVAARHRNLHRLIDASSALASDDKDEITEAIVKLPPDQLACFRRWFTAFEAGRTDHAEELELHRNQTWPPCRPRVSQIKKTREGTVSKKIKTRRDEIIVR